MKLANPSSAWKLAIAAIMHCSKQSKRAVVSSSAMSRLVPYGLVPSAKPRSPRNRLADRLAFMAMLRYNATVLGVMK